MIKIYYKLTKPGIIFGNLITAVGGFALASRGMMDGWLLLAMLAGVSFIIGSACVFNNYTDRYVDQKMTRTQHRALAKGTIPVRDALIFASILLFLGIVVLAVYTNLLTLFVALVGFVMYVLVYRVWKYRTTYGTAIGSIAGAAPPVIGYCAVTGRFDFAALILFLIVALWQMPHFFAIAIYRLHEYKAAGIPVLPVEKGIHVTQVHMLLYIVAFTLVAGSLTLFGYTGVLYFLVVTLFGCAWLVLAMRGFKSDQVARWARKMFVFSLVVITALCFMIFVDTI